MISIIGAGPVGNYLAARLARDGQNVQVFEEHQSIGAPVACTGILTSYLSDFFTVDPEYVVNTITATDVYAPDGSSVRIPLKKNFIVDRTLFDAHLAEEAQSSGVTYHTGWRFTDYQKKNNQYQLHFLQGKTATTNVLVGADGPSSAVARSAGIFGERSFVVGHQARVRLREKVDPSVIAFFLDEHNYIGWMVPETDRIVRLGVASHINVNKHFSQLLKKYPGILLGWQSGPIPIYNPRLDIEKDNVYLLGDAATQVKATTYGGIIPGMHAADVLSNVLHKQLSSGSYTKGVAQTAGKHLGKHLLLRKLMNKFTPEDYNRLVQLCASKRVRDTLHKYDREYPGKLLMALAVQEPRFLGFSKVLLRSSR